MKNAIIAGIIAGIASGIVMAVFAISGLYELFSVAQVPEIFNKQTLSLFNIIFSIVWGIVFGVFYAFFYDYIPSKGIKKGLVYGLIIWIITPIHNAGVMAMYGAPILAIPYAIATFFSFCIVYGIVIAYAYKPKK